MKVNKLEIENKKNLLDKVGKFSRSFSKLLVTSDEILRDTVGILFRLVTLSDKVLPLKSYFNVVQDTQRTTCYADQLANIHYQAIDDNTDLTAKQKAELKKQNYLKLAARGAPELVASLASIYWENAPNKTNVSLKIFEQEIVQSAQRHLCTEDVFMIACAFLGVRIAKQGSVYYLDGESPDFSETKKNRTPQDLSDEIVLKDLVKSIARPDSRRGVVERSQIDSGFNHIVKLNDLQMTMHQLVEWMKQGEATGEPRRKIDARSLFDLSDTDYEHIMTVARREGLLEFKKKKDPTNNYVLRTNNHGRVLEYAERSGHSPQKALNEILDAFFQMLENQTRAKNREKLVLTEK